MDKGDGLHPVPSRTEWVPAHRSVAQTDIAFLLTILGHVKAVMVDFGYAKYHGGRCYLRYDDTNPEAEEGRFFQSILETVRWLGFEPWKITYSSDNFQRLYELAVELIRRGKGYVCTCDGTSLLRSCALGLTLSREDQGRPRRGQRQPHCLRAQGSASRGVIVGIREDEERRICREGCVSADEDGPEFRQSVYVGYDCIPGQECPTSSHRRQVE